MTKIANIPVQNLDARTRSVYDELLGAWLESLTENAQSSYRSDLEHFRRWLGAPDVATAMQALFTLDSPKANGVVLRYRKSLLIEPVYSTAARMAGGPPDRKGFAPATINRRLAAIRSVARIARITGVFDGHIEIKGVRVNVSTPSKAGVSHTDYIAMLDHIEARMLDDDANWFLLVRDRAILRMLHDLFLRRVEVVRLELKDVDFANLELDVRSKGHRGRRDTVPMTERVAETVRVWLEARGTEEGALFSAPDRAGEHLAPSSINRLVEKWSLRGAGVRCRPHDLRRIAITTGLNRSQDLRAVAAAARHRNPATTMRYDQSRVAAARNLSDLVGES